jgi:hypothetical protein
MTSLSEAFAGFAKSFTGEDAAPQSAHGKFIYSQVLPLTAKLQREIRGRHYKVSALVFFVLMRCHANAHHVLLR